MSEKERIKRTLNSEEEEKWSKLISLADEYSKMTKKIGDKFPYHVNPIEELHANENANSRILCAMLRYQIDGEYKILKSFVDHFLPNAGIREKIKNPTITHEQYRIDLSVREKGEYALIFENKIHDAVLQKNQLARYIEALHNSEGFDYKQIYVIFLPSSYDYDTNDCCWYIPEDCCKSCNGECKIKDKDPKLREDFEKQGRYIKVSFREGILPWLKEYILPNILYKETLLQAAVIIYIDYLKGLFNLRTTEKDMVMELEQFIIKKLELSTKDSVIEKIKILDDKLQNINMIKTTMDSCRQRIISETLSAQMEIIGKNIEIDMSEYGLNHELNTEKEDRYFSLGFKKQDWELYIIIECYKDERSFVYIGLHNENNPKNQYNNDTIIFKEETYLSNHPYGWEWTKYLDNFNLLWNDICVDNGKKFEEFVKEKLSEILKKIDINNIRMSPNA